jgi:hypothetical protein
MPSRSPLAEADQRLNIDWFAEHFDVPPGRAKTGAGDGHPPELADFAEPASGGDKQLPPTVVEQPAIRTRADRTTIAEVRESEKAPARTILAQPATKSSPAPGTRFQQPRTPGPVRDRETAPDSGRQMSSRGSRPAVTPSPREESPDPPDQARRSTRVNVQSKPAALRTPPVAKQREQAVDPTLDALRQAMRWVEGRPSPPREQKQQGRASDSTPSKPQARLGEGLDPRALRPLTEVRPVTQLEIGKIEIEIAPPVQPAPRAPASRPPAKAAGSRGATRHAFGWRQR